MFLSNITMGIWWGVLIGVFSCLSSSGGEDGKCSISLERGAIFYEAWRDEEGLGPAENFKGAAGLPCRYMICLRQFRGDCEAQEVQKLQLSQRLTEIHWGICKIVIMGDKVRVYRTFHHWMTCWRLMTVYFLEVFTAYLVERWRRTVLPRVELSAKWHNWVFQWWKDVYQTRVGPIMLSWRSLGGNMI